MYSICALCHSLSIRPLGQIPIVLQYLFPEHQNWALHGMNCLSLASLGSRPCSWGWASLQGSWGTGSLLLVCSTARAGDRADGWEGSLAKHRCAPKWNLNRLGVTLQAIMKCKCQWKVLSHNSTEELKLKAMFNLSNTYQRTNASCVCYTLAVPGYWEKGIHSSRGGSIHAGCGNGQEGNV